MRGIKNRLNQKWWFRSIRGYNWFSFRYWWFNYVIWAILIALLLWLLLKFTYQPPQCNRQSEITALLNSIHRQLENCCICDVPNNYQDSIVRDTIRPPTPEPPRRNDSIPKPPSKNCRVHFSGLFMGNNYTYNYISEIYKVDDFSEYVGSGFYPDNSKAFPKSVKATFDGIAIDKGTRLIIYSKKNFQGNILLDINGPAIVNNIKHIDNPAVNFCNTINFKASLQNNYPQSVRKWSKSNMWDWSYGSCKIICSE